MVGSVARVPQIVAAGRLTQDTARLDFVSGGEDIKNYLYWVLRTPQYRGYCAGRLTGSASASFSREDFLAFPVPPISPGSRVVVSILQAIEAKIDISRRISATLEGIARALFKSWFVDFDPVRGTATVPEAIRRLFPGRLVGSRIGPVPESWEVSNVANVATVNARTAKTAALPETICYADISSASTDGVVTPVELSRASAPSRARRRLSHGDTVLSTVRPERRAHFLCLNPPSNMIASTGFATLTPSRVPWSYLYAAVCRPVVFDTLGHLASGGAYPAIRPAVVAGLPIVLPSTDLLARFHEIAAPMFEQRATLEAESKTLAEVRDTLLPILISGEARLATAS
jgi:type I restriction enzyme S subunit